MASLDDAYRHRPDRGDTDWLETHWFTFLVPEIPLRGWFYTAFRTEQETALSLIVFWSGDCSSRADADYWDSRVHVPTPNPRLESYELPNGLSVQMVEPMQHYRIDFEGRRSTGAHLDLYARTAAFDDSDLGVEDPHDAFDEFYPREESSTEEGSGGTIGHVDQTMQVQGTVTLHGRTHTVDFPSSRDHSWGPRPEIGHRRGNFDSGCFGDDFGFHVKTLNPTMDTGRVMNGYLYRDDEQRSLRSGRGFYEFDGWRMTDLRYELEDEAGQEYVLEGEPRGIFPITTFPNLWTTAALVRWSWEDRVGWGEYLWSWGVDEMNRFRHGEESP